MSTSPIDLHAGNNFGRPDPQDFQQAGSLPGIERLERDPLSNSPGIQNHQMTPEEIQMKNLLLEQKIKAQMEIQKEPRADQLDRIRQENRNYELERRLEQERRIQQDNHYRNIIAQQLRDPNFVSQLNRRQDGRSRLQSFQSQLSRTENHLQVQGRERSKSNRDELQQDLKKQRSGGK